MSTTQLKALLASYLRSILSAVAALYLAGVTDPKTLAWSLVAALLPVAVRAVNPKDKAFGIVPSAEVVAEALKDVKTVKAPVKSVKTSAKSTVKTETKPATKKTTTKK
ncbi:MAG: hypothetical protein EBT86_07495 [Actinobacteria bacterium]|nr:hypothetical protein [Actinomycetota bacterium]